MHSDNELQEILHTRLQSRQTLHEWPLSCVQLLTTASGDKYIYKSQFGPTVESQFYARARSPLLTRARTLYEREGDVILLVDYIDGKLLQDQGYSPLELLETGKMLVDTIAHIEGDLPCYQDISTLERWREYVGRTLQAVGELIQAGTFTEVTVEDTDLLRKWAFRPVVLEAFRGKISTTHGDANGGNIFLTETGYKMIDWQRPIKAPAETDLAALLESQNIESHEYVHPAMTGIFYFTRIAWAVECQVEWIAEADCYDSWVKRFLQKIIKSAANLP
jgi:hypothetical protein